MIYINDIFTTLGMYLRKFIFGFSQRIYGNIYRTNLGINNIIHRGTYVYDCNFGDFSYCGCNCIIQSADIGKFTSIGNNVQIINTHHDMDSITTYPLSLLGLENEAVDLTTRTSIGHDVWIGSSTIILPGKNIGNGSIIGAGSIVTKDVPAYTIVAGNPARHIRDRKKTEITSNVGSWWDLPVDQIKLLLMK